MLSKNPLGVVAKTETDSVNDPPSPSLSRSLETSLAKPTNVPTTHPEVPVHFLDILAKNTTCLPMCIIQKTVHLPPINSASQWLLSLTETLLIHGGNAHVSRSHLGIAVAFLAIKTRCQ